MFLPVDRPIGISPSWTACRAHRAARPCRPKVDGAADQLALGTGPHDTLVGYVFGKGGVMLKFIAAVGRHRAWSDAEWQRHYHDHHGPLVASTAGFTTQTLGYRQNYIRPFALPDALPAPDRIGGVTELWFDDLAAMDRAFAAPDYLRNVRPDEGRFADSSIAIMGLGEETTIHDRSEMSGEKRWACQPLIHLFVFQSSSALEGVETVRARRHTRMITSAAARLFPTARAFSSVDELWFDDDVQALACGRDILRKQPASTPEPPLLLLTQAHTVFDRRLLQH
jgi:uncharacterized protein (TIGR02118 family)